MPHLFQRCHLRIGKPLVGTVSRRVENFTRLETFGENDNVFVFDQRIVAANLVRQ